MEIRVYYPFHPQRGKTFKAEEGAPKEKDCTFIRDQDGYVLKTPKWMCEPEATCKKLNTTPSIEVNALLDAASFIKAFLDAKVLLHGGSYEAAIPIRKKRKEHTSQKKY